MSTPISSGGHLDLDALADATAADNVTESSAAHLAECAQCRAGLEEVRAASALISADLSALPVPTVPDDVAARLGDAFRDAAGAPASSASVTTLPTAARWSPRRWLPAAAAIALLLAGAGYGISRLGGGNNVTTAASGSAAKAAAAPDANLVRNSSGADYTDRASLTAALPQLLAGTAAQRDALAAAPGGPAPLRGAAPPNSSAPTTGTTMQTAADPLARLRDNAGLADCLVALLPPDDPSVRPLALDYASYRGTPALIVILPSHLSDKLDVYVVGAGCSRANDSTLFYASVDKP
ncbi:MAG: hypothetical protein JWO88_1518 [Frankiales bacterium]|nr:hypothetical protein [Frankiales bacterium]